MNLKLFCKAILLFAIFAQSVFPQSNNPSNGKVPDMHLKPVVPFISSAALGGDLAYGYESISGIFISMPVPAGTPFTVISNWQAPNFASSMVRGGDGNYYLLDFYYPTLYQVDPVSGIVALVGNITGMSGANGNGIAYDGMTGKYYIAGGNFGVTNNLYELDINSLAATLIGSFQNPSGAMIDISIDANTGIGYGYDLIDDQAYTFDPATGSGSALGPLGFDANFGQGMDIDQATGTIYLSAFNNGTFTGQLRTMNPVNGNTTLIVDWGFAQVAPFAINNDYGEPIGPGLATNPNPPNGAIDVSINLQQLQWENPAGATEIEVYFGDSPNNLDLIYSGTLVNTISVSGFFNYSTTYYWKVNEIDSTGTTYGSFWFFTIEDDPNSPILFEDNFENGLSNWTIINNGGTCDWDLFDIASRAYIMPPTATGNAFAADVDYCGPGTSINSSAIVGPIDATNYNLVLVEFDNDFRILGSDECLMDVSIDGGATWINIFHWTTENRNSHEFYDISSLVKWKEFSIRLTSIQPDWDWWWAIDNFKIYAYLTWYYPPAAPSNLVAVSIVQGEVELNWQDNSNDEDEFILRRKLGDSSSTNQYSTVKILPPNTETFTDSTVQDTTTYTYYVQAYNGVLLSDSSNLATVTTVIPVELTSFTATITLNSITLNWQTATETNNSGFEIERTSPLPSPYEGEGATLGRSVVGFVPGFGTTAEPKSYSFTDENLSAGIYQYRLRQIDFDGSFEYSNTVEVEITSPLEFSLEQNYPNPFNPTTRIKYTIPSVTLSLSKGDILVSLKVFDVLGNEISTLVHEQKQPGTYEVEFNVGQAISLSSGVYYYQLQSGGFTQTKKMLLMK